MSQLLDQVRAAIRTRHYSIRTGSSRGCLMMSRPALCNFWSSIGGA